MKKLEFNPTNLFNEDMGRLASLDQAIVDEAHEAIDLLCELHELPEEFNDHKLTRKYEGYREFHIRDTTKGDFPSDINDVVVIYRIVERKLIVIGARIGSHNRLFRGQGNSKKYRKSKH
ncbi:type II toxin-antitoxin system YafQ family toxin [Lactobacillus sp. ESL0791]|uniref:type II toxin-antitoxin system YafQ family toxin n=1 Tax=Lactobacillus sp. ESL0791 TaxID=2983234 RepID=UPI0023F65643|nr:type II toxin-antitoxin system YafQ family toxin [Lactobacillus sp. ESL0791]MDF7638650.1 type II toxin-antitoxin system YafQ family toxin [Lactobacillus sp. ESL0791]